MKKIETKRLAELLRAEAKLEALEIWGVDNWEGYYDALTDDSSGESYKDIEDWSNEDITASFENVD